MYENKNRLIKKLFPDNGFLKTYKMFFSMFPLKKLYLILENKMKNKQNKKILASFSNVENHF